MRFFLLCFILCVLSSKGQKHFYDLIPRVPPDYSYDPDSAYNMLMSVQDDVLTEKAYKDYATGLAYYHQRMLNTGSIYFDWKEIEDYLNGLVKKVLTQVKTDKKFSVYLVRNEDLNATAQDNGIIYIYIGLLAEVQDEADLICSLGHEISHALNNDTKKNFLAAQNNKKHKIKEVLLTSHQNRIFEAQADSLGFELATLLDYDLSSSYHTFIKFESDYRWYKRQYSYQDPKWYIALDNQEKDNGIKPDSLEKYLLDHPENLKRLSALNKFMKAKNGKNKFSGNEDFFKSIQYKARMEQLFIDFSEASYKYCLRNAFYYHLMDQNDKNYLYYITESLRRLILADPSIKRLGFMTEDCKEAVFEERKGILHDLSFICLDTVFMNRVKKDAVYGLDKKPFETYLQAYNHFAKLSQEKGVPELSLTTGLFELNRNKKEKGYEDLKKYSAENPLKNNNFIKAALADEVLHQLKTNVTDFVYIAPVEYYSIENRRFKYDYFESTKISERTTEIFKRFKPGQSPTTLISADKANITDYLAYEYLAMQLHFFKPEKEVEFEQNSDRTLQNEAYWKAMENNDPLNPDLLKRNKNFFYLNPDYWVYFKDNNIRSFTYIKPYFYKYKLGTFFVFEIAYYDPIRQKYLYFEQENAERLNELNLNKISKQFYEKLNK